MRAIIVDDEELARAYLRELLSVHSEIEIAAECRNGFEAVKAINELTPELVFLDVQMPKLDGFEVLELIDCKPAVIFVTAYDQYAMRAFDAQAADYLLKPFTTERFERALERAKVGGARPVAPPPREVARLVVRDGAKVHVIPLPKLDYAEAQDDYVALHTEGKSYLKQQTIAALEAALDRNRFVRIHRSYVVNLERIARIEPLAKDSKVAVLAGGERLPVSRAGYARLMEAMGEAPGANPSQGNRSETL